jgi:hypothetical protein
MDILDRKELEQLGTRKDGWHVSIYMPTHRAGGEVQQDPIRLKNLLAKAEENLREWDLRPPEIASVLEPGFALLDDHIFWRRQSDGLAILAARDAFHTYRLPSSFEEEVIIGPSFYIKPLLPIVSHGGLFYVLALSQGQIRLVQGTRYTVGEVDLEDVPDSLAEALRLDDPEARLQFHTTTGPGHGKGGAPTAGTGAGRQAAFHGTGAPADDEKDGILRYFQLVDKGMEELLAGQQIPLVLAGVDYLLPLYREASSYDHILEEGIVGNPEQLSTKELHQRAWALVQPRFLEEQEEAARLYQQLAGGDRAVAELNQAVPAAHYGRVATLFVPVDLQRWGTFDANTNQIDVHEELQPGDIDLMDLAAVQTLINGGTVYAVESDRIPGEGPLAAILRY